MEITGKIIQVLPPRTGTSARTGSEWVCGQYVLETMEQYPKKIFFEVFGSERIQQFNIQVGESLTVSFDIESREYNGRWFTSIRAFKVDRSGAQPAPLGETLAEPIVPPFEPSGESDGTDLPF